MLVSIPVSNLVSGVSQQAPTMRYPSQASEQINCRSSLIEGLSKRPPTKHIARVFATTGGNMPLGFNGDTEKSAVHFINRDETERYAILALQYRGIREDLSAGPVQELRVAGLDGTLYAVVYDTGTKDYLTCNSPQDDLRFLTIADYTFVVNRTKTVAETGLLTAARNTEALVTIVAGNYNSDYSITVGGTTYTYVTSATDSNTIKTTTIAEGLRSYLQGGGGYTAPTGITVSVVGSTLWLRRGDTTDFDITYTDSQSQRSMTLVKGEAQVFTDLPTVAPDGFKAKISGDPESVEDEYWVAFRTTDGSVFGEGVWEESFAPGVHYQLDGTTMPHVLVREPDGSGGIQFRLKKGTWSERTVGDEVTAESPAFVGKSINDLFFFKNRLGFISGIDKVTMSEAGHYFNFWRTTVTTVVDSDPIDVGVAHSRVSKIQAAVPFNDRLLLFSGLSQFSLGSTGEVLSPSTVSVTQTTEFESDLQARPVAAGRSIIFAESRGGFAGVREYVQVGNLENEYDAIDTTANVSKYLKSRVREIEVSTTGSMAVVRTDYPAPADTDPPTLYVYEYFINGSEKIQSAWSKWTFNNATRIHGLGWIDTDLYIVIERAGGFYLESIRVADGVVDSGGDYEIKLDRKVGTLTGTYQADGNTDFTLSYGIGNGENLVVVSDGQPFNYVSKDYNSTTDVCTLSISGDHSSSQVYVGVAYPMGYTFGPQYIRSENRAITSGRLGLTYGKMLYNDTAYFKVKVTPDSRPTYEYEFNPGYINSEIVLDAAVDLRTGEFVFPIHARNTEVKVEIVNDTYLPCNVMSAEFEGNFVTRRRS